MNAQYTKLLRHNETTSKRETHCSECLQKETGEQPDSTPERSRAKRSKCTQEK